jgi:hypothetical protein
VIPGLHANIGADPGPVITDDQFVRRVEYVKRVIDGDTFEFVIDLGYRNTTRQLIRLRDYSAPELHEPGGKQAKLIAENIFARAQQIFVRSYKDQMSFARWIADVYVDGESLADMLRTTTEDMLLATDPKGIDHDRVIASDGSEAAREECIRTVHGDTIGAGNGPTVGGTSGEDA